MPSRAATYPGISTFPARPYTGRDYRRTIVGGAFLGLGGAGAAAMMAGTAAVAAAWLVSSLLSNNAEFRTSAPITMGMRLPLPEMRLAAPSDMFGGALAAANPAYAPEEERSGKLALAALPAARQTVPLRPSKHRLEVIASVPLPRARPMQFAEVEARLETEARPHDVRAASVRAAPSTNIASAAPASGLHPHAPQNGEAVYNLASADAVPSSRVAPVPPAHPMQFSEVQARLEAEARPDDVRAASVPAAPSTNIATAARAAAPHPQYAPQNGEAVYSLASADVVPPPLAAPALAARPTQFSEVQARLEAEARPHVVRVVSIPAAPSPHVEAPAPALHPAHNARQNGEAVYSLASADVVPPETTGSIGAATGPAAVPSAVRPAKPAAPALAYAAPDVPMRDNHTAIYDIVAHTVYMPDGERLEAHSGLGRMLDDPQYASAKARGPTPPNVYDLTLRDGLFHGVQALRLNPVKDSKMYGRDGILAHTYMLGASGASFGCVSFKHYDAFLQAFRRGEVNRMVVVPHLQEPPPGVRADAGGGERYASNSVKDY